MSSDKQASIVLSSGRPRDRVNKQIYYNIVQEGGKEERRKMEKKKEMEMEGEGRKRSKF